MNKFEIRKKALDLRYKIEEGYTTFVFEPKMEEYIKELSKIEENCVHEFQQGICVWCGKRK